MVEEGRNEARTKKEREREREREKREREPRLICCAVTALYLRRWDVAVAWIVILYCTVCWPGVPRPSARSTACPNTATTVRRTYRRTELSAPRTNRLWSVAFHVYRCYTRAIRTTLSYGTAEYITASSKTEERASCESISPACPVPPPSPPETGRSNRLESRVPASRFLIRPIHVLPTRHCCLVNRCFATHRSRCNRSVTNLTGYIDDRNSIFQLQLWLLPRL